MRLIESSVEIIPQESGLDGIYKQIERAGRLCYKSEDKICEGSAEKMVKFLTSRGHGSPLEAGTVYLKIPVNIDVAGDFLDDNFVWTKCNLVEEETGNWWAITTNYRRIIECGWGKHLQYLCEPTEHHEKRISIKFTLSRSIANEFVRHRVFSFCQESQRYCGYNKSQFDGQITFIIPEWVKDRINEIASYNNNDDLMQSTYSEVINDLRVQADETIDIWSGNIENVELDYMKLIELGLKPQEARSVLTNDCKTELMMTGYLSDWEHFLKLRKAPGAHPDARILANQLEFILLQNGILH